MIEAISKGVDNPGIDKLLTFWNEKIIVNLSKFHINKNILESIDEIDQRIQKIDQLYHKDDEEDKISEKDENEKEEKEENDEAYDNKSLMLEKTQTSCKNIGGSQLLFNTPFANELFQNTINDSTEENNENIVQSLDNASFVYKKEELNKNVISMVRYKEVIIGYMDLDLLLQRIAMEEPIFNNKEMNDYLLEGLCLQHSIFISSDFLMTKIISCFKYNCARYLNNGKDSKVETEEFTKSLTFENKKKGIFLDSKDIENMKNDLELFKDTEKRIPYGIIHLVTIYINIYQKYSLSHNIDLSIASKIIELLDTGLNIIEIKNICEKEIVDSRTLLKEMIKNTIEPKMSNKKMPFDKIYKIKENHSFFEITDFTSKDVATELTRISFLLFSKISPKEFFKGLFTKKDKEKTSPNICRVVERFNTISFWVIEEVLSYDYSSARAKVIEKFIHIANELRELNNFNDCMSIISALGQMIVTKLSKTWKKVSSKNMTLLNKIKRVLNFQNNYKHIREEISKCLENEKPFLPFLGYYTKRICFLEESGPYVKSGLINVNKISQVEQIISEFYDKDKVKYNLEIKESIRNKLSILQCLEPINESDLEKKGNDLEPNFVPGKKNRNKRITNTEIKFGENYNKTYIV